MSFPVQFNLHVSRECRGNFTISFDRSKVKVDIFFGRWPLFSQLGCGETHRIYRFIGYTRDYISPNEYHFVNRLRPVCTAGRECRRDNRAKGNNSNPQIIVLSGLEAERKARIPGTWVVEDGTSSGLGNLGNLALEKDKSPRFFRNIIFATMVRNSREPMSADGRIGLKIIELRGSRYSQQSLDKQGVFIPGEMCHFSNLQRTSTYLQTQRKITLLCSSCVEEF
ncbi:hypothetical protein K0M31_002362 [Melipona bicolor]|uniref:Uncharacterized protein n=1 Tax=Melipona bicolor TaxID=60889 RepID=A0AA40KYS6_9HYME|nr:hypothetical protein K0M31_002362 [Melipona bicolor]